MNVQSEGGDVRPGAGLSDRLDTSEDLALRVRRARNEGSSFALVTLRKDVFKFRVQSFGAFGVDLRVEASPGATRLFDMHGRWVGYDEYVFEIFGSDPRPMSVRVDATWKIKIYYLGQWSPICVYLQNLLSKTAKSRDRDGSTYPPTIKDDFLQLSRWWAVNGQKFQLLALPPEIRQTIFAWVWGTAVEPYPTMKCRRLVGPGVRDLVERMPSKALLLTCRKVYEEASHVLFSSTVFLTRHIGVLAALTRNLEQRHRVRKLELALSHDDFLRLFTKDIGAVHGVHPAARALRDMDLSQVIISIAPPSYTSSTGIFDGACQRASVDMIFEKAWPMVRGHPVRLAGFIKQTQKLAFENKFLLERKAYEQWQQDWGRKADLNEYDLYLNEEDGGVRLEGFAGDRMQMEDDQSPQARDMQCYCTAPCTWETWTEGD